MNQKMWTVNVNNNGLSSLSRPSNNEPSSNFEFDIKTGNVEGQCQEQGVAIRYSLLKTYMHVKYERVTCMINNISIMDLNATDKPNC